MGRTKFGDVEYGDRSHCRCGELRPHGNPRGVQEPPKLSSEQPNRPWPKNDWPQADDLLQEAMNSVAVFHGE